MSLLELKSNIKKARKRVGRGNASGHGTYSCRGMKGQSARAGGRRRPGFEGGQTPYLRKMPKLRGFKNPNYITYQVVNVGQLNIFDDGAEVTLANLLEKNLVSKKTLPVKLLGGKGALEKKLTIKVDAATATAIKAVENSGGMIEVNKAAKDNGAAKAKTPKAKAGKASKEAPAETTDEKPEKTE